LVDTNVDPYEDSSANPETIAFIELGPTIQRGGIEVQRAPRLRLVAGASRTFREAAHTSP
jgi:hypothetical protein